VYYRYEKTAKCLVMLLFVGFVASVGLAHSCHSRVALAADNTARAETPTFGAAEAEELREVQTVPSTIEQIRTGGSWCDGNRQGPYRIIVWAGGFEEVYHHLYLQFLEASSEQHRLFIVRTIPIHETLGIDLLFRQIDLRLLERGICANVMFEGVVDRRTVEGKIRSERFTLRVTQRGEYKIEFHPVSGSSSESGAK
jgi:hypothetical protein